LILSCDVFAGWGIEASGSEELGGVEIAGIEVAKGLYARGVFVEKVDAPESKVGWKMLFERQSFTFN